MTQVHHGRCFCGACTFTLTGPATWAGHCHCESCRRITASPFTTWAGFPTGHWSLDGAALVTFDSSPGTTRGFCGRCGSPLFYQSSRWPDERHIYVALLDRPEAITPTLHYHAGERLAFIHLADGLPAAPPA
jgi:hypothetical protein